MSEPTQPDAEAPSSEPAPASTPAPESAAPPSPPSDAPITAREAADLIAGKPAAPSAPDGADAAPERPRGETDGNDPPQEPIEAPRSWTKDEKATFATLPREHQERLIALDRTRELELRRAQNDAAEQRQAAAAWAQQAEQANLQAQQQYEQSLPEKALLLDARYREEFGTPTQAEVNEWADTDPAKWIRWNNAAQHLTAARTELQQVQQRQYQQQQEQWQQYYQNAEVWKAEEAKKFAEKAPEWKDPKTYHTKVAQTLDYMERMGFPKDETSRYATEFVPMNIHDHRLQLIIRNGMLYEEAIEAARQPSRAPVPPVQRPGSAPNRGEAQEARFKDLNRQLERTGSIRDGAALIAARMNGRS